MVRRMLLATVIVSSTCLTIGTSVGAAAASATVTASTQTLAAPDTGATGFGDGFSLDVRRAVVAAKVGPSRVVYVFDHNANGTWSHSGTIHAPAGSTASWGAYVAVSGATIAVADPDSLTGTENYGVVHVFDLVSGAWKRVQTLRQTGSFLTFAQGVWLTGDGLVVRSAGYCDGSCNYGGWILYERDHTHAFVPLFNSAPKRRAVAMNVGVDGGRLVVGNPGFGNEFSCEPESDSSLMAWDMNPNPGTVVLDQTVPFEGNPCGGPVDDWFRQVDISGNVIAYEACCTNRKELHVLRDQGSTFAESVVPISKLSDALLAVPNAVLRADAAAGVFHTVVYNGTAWVNGNDVSLPPDAVFPSPPTSLRALPVAAGNLVAIRGSESLHILTVTTGTPQCLGGAVTVDLSLGQVPTAGNDVILGTPGDDTINAGSGDDRVCAGGGNDTIAGGDGNDIIDAGPGNDVINAGNDNDSVNGGAGNDVVGGGNGDDLVAGGDDNDWLIGGAGTDIGSGGPGTDTASGCETTYSVP